MFFTPGSAGFEDGCLALGWSGLIPWPFKNCSYSPPVYDPAESEKTILGYPHSSKIRFRNFMTVPAVLFLIFLPQPKPENLSTAIIQSALLQ